MGGCTKARQWHQVACFPQCLTTPSLDLVRAWVACHIRNHSQHGVTARVASSQRRWKSRMVYVQRRRLLTGASFRTPSTVCPRTLTSSDTSMQTIYVHSTPFNYMKLI